MPMITVVYKTGGIMDKEFLLGLAAEMSEDVIEAILEKAGQENAAWQEKYDQAVAAHTRQREEMILEQSITALGGRNQKAIAALLDTQQIFAADDPKQALQEALENLKKDCSYLFESPQIPPFSRSAGTGDREIPTPVTLAGALKARMKK